MKETAKEKELDHVFKYALIAKGVFGLFELLGGLSLLTLSSTHVRNFIAAITAHDVVGDNYSPIWQWFEHLGARFDVHATLFAGIYLMLHGIIKLVLVWALLSGHIWAYPWMVLALILFIAYQVFDMMHHFTWMMLGLTAFDVFILVLTIREWMHERRL